MSPSIKKIGEIVVVVAFVLTVGMAVKFSRFILRDPHPGEAQAYEFYEVKTGTSPAFVARELERLGIVSNGRLLYWYARATGRSKFKSGDYRFTNHMTPDEVLAVVRSGISYGEPFTVPEGYNLAEIAEAYGAFRKDESGARARFIALTSDARFIATLGFDSPPRTLEGYLFPETYLIGRKTTETEILRSMVKHFRAVFTPQLGARARELGFTEHQIVTLASIIEKETGAPDDRGKIASVFHNRLKKHMRLQSDPTVIYGIKGYEGKIHKRDLETPTPYNTYTIPALPPGPIASPGKSALMAALYPPETPYLYFVSHNDGTSEFTATLEDHNKAVAKYQLDPKAREGKSWRDLSKRVQDAAAVKN